MGAVTMNAFCVCLMTSEQALQIEFRPGQGRDADSAQILDPPAWRRPSSAGMLKRVRQAAGLHIGQPVPGMPVRVMPALLGGGWTFPSRPA